MAFLLIYKCLDSITYFFVFFVLIVIILMIILID